jgi:hypothetical protein
MVPNLCVEMTGRDNVRLEFSQVSGQAHVYARDTVHFFRNAGTTLRPRVLRCFFCTVFHPKAWSPQAAAERQFL